MAGGGGAWKVAYADFVTAMMALFLVLWITAQDIKIKEAVQRAFNHPFSSLTKSSAGILPNQESQSVRSQEGNFDSASAVELTMLRRLNQDLLKSLDASSEQASDNPVRLQLRPEGLRISIFDRATKPIFEKDSDRLTDYGRWIYSTLSWEIARYPSFLIELEGHTEKGYRPARPDYDSWDLSASQANASRRFLVLNGVQTEQIRKVTGFSDTDPMSETPPEDPSNRRVSVMLKVKQTQ